MLGKALSHDDNLQFKHWRAVPMLAPRQGVHDSWSFRPIVIFFKEHTLSLLVPVKARAAAWGPWCSGSGWGFDAWDRGGDRA